jgi:hypothetical protein
MKKNMNSIDKLIRLVSAVIFVTLYVTGTASGAVGIALLILAATLSLTSFISFCPIYAVFGISFCNIDAESDADA